MVRKSPPVMAHPETWEIICAVCETAKPKEAFHRYPTGTYAKTCRACVHARGRDRKNAAARERRREDLEVARRADRVEYQRDREKRLERSRRAYHADPDRHRERHRRWREAHAEEARAYNRAYYALNRERLVAAERERRARRRQE